MAEKEKFKIEIYRKKDPGELTDILSDPNGKLDVGSSAALTAAQACAFALRSARIAAMSVENERMDYILRNLAKLREYFVYLIDEDVKGRNILRRAEKEGDPYKIEAARQPASAISDEVICQAINMIDLIDELSALAPRESAVYLGAATELAVGAIRTARLFVLAMSCGSSDETYAFVVRRENEIRLEELTPKTGRILAWVDEALR